MSYVQNALFRGKPPHLTIAPDTLLSNLQCVSMCPDSLSNLPMVKAFSCAVLKRRSQYMYAVQSCQGDYNSQNVHFMAVLWA